MLAEITMVVAVLVSVLSQEGVTRRSVDTRLTYYVINMDHEVERYDRFVSRYETSNLPWHALVRYPAVRGSSIDVRQYMSSTARTEFDEIQSRGYRTKHHQLSEGAVGVWLSHLGVWRTVLRDGHAVAMVFEDDAIFDESLADALSSMTIPDDTDIALLGHQCMECTSSTSADWYKVRRFYELHGYLITRQGIQKALRYIGPLEKQIDSWLSDLAVAGHLTIYASKRRGLVRQDKSFLTSIQTPINPLE